MSSHFTGALTPEILTSNHRRIIFQFFVHIHGFASSQYHTSSGYQWLYSLIFLVVFISSFTYAASYPPGLSIFEYEY